jgi:hypothetical protein
MKKKEESHLDTATLFFATIALILIIIGIFLNVNSTSAIGISQPNKYGQGGGRVEELTGTAVIMLGLLIAVLPLKDCFCYFKDRLLHKKK